MALLPALADGDLSNFGARAHARSRRSPAAGLRPCRGARSPPASSEELVRRMREWGARGVGQSSWGPAVYGIVDGDDDAQRLADRARDFVGDEGVVYAGPFRSEGARVWTEAYDNAVRPVLASAPNDSESLAHSHWRGAGAHLHRLRLRVEHVQSTHPGAVSRQPVVVQSAVHHIHNRARAAGSERGIRRTVGRASRAARGGDGGRVVLRHGPADRRCRPGAAPVCAGVSRHGPDRRHRLRARLHLSGQHAGEVVSRSPRHGDRDGDHGIWRRRVRRRLSQRLPHGSRRRRPDSDGRSA